MHEFSSGIWGVSRQRRAYLTVIQHLRWHIAAQSDTLLTWGNESNTIKPSNHPLENSSASFHQIEQLFGCSWTSTDLESAWTTKQMGWLSPSSLWDGVQLSVNWPGPERVWITLCGPLSSSSETLWQAAEEHDLGVNFSHLTEGSVPMSNADLDFPFYSRGDGCSCFNADVKGPIDGGVKSSSVGRCWRQERWQIQSLCAGGHRRIHWSHTRQTAE